MCFATAAPSNAGSGCLSSFSSQFYRFRFGITLRLTAHCPRRFRRLAVSASKFLHAPQSRMRPVRPIPLALETAPRQAAGSSNIVSAAGAGTGGTVSFSVSNGLTLLSIGDRSSAVRPRRTCGKSFATLRQSRADDTPRPSGAAALARHGCALDLYGSIVRPLQIQW